MVFLRSLQISELINQAHTDPCFLRSLENIISFEIPVFLRSLENIIIFEIRVFFEIFAIFRIDKSSTHKEMLQQCISAEDWAYILSKYIIKPKKFVCFRRRCPKEKDILMEKDFQKWTTKPICEQVWTYITLWSFHHDVWSTQRHQEVGRHNFGRVRSSPRHKIWGKTTHRSKV